MEIKLNIQAHSDREKVVSALANSGYSVRVEVETYLANDTYYVIFEYTDTLKEQAEEK